MSIPLARGGEYPRVLSIPLAQGGEYPWVLSIPLPLGGEYPRVLSIPLARGGEYPRGRAFFNLQIESALEYLEHRALAKPGALAAPVLSLVERLLAWCGLQLAQR
jgi:hypothetical protein